LSCAVELWENTLEKEGRTPQRKDLKKYEYPVSGDTYFRRFGTWKKALIKAYNSIDANNIDVTSVSKQNITTPFTRSHKKNKEKRESLSLRKRFFVMKRDSFACALCGASGHGIRLEVDHKKPFAQGGTDELDNLQTLCFDCNRGKRDSFE